MYTYKTIQRKANEAGCTLRKGYQRYLDSAFGGYVTDENSNKITGYEVMDWRLGAIVCGSHNGLHDHALTLDEATEVIKDYCEAYSIKF